MTAALEEVLELPGTEADVTGPTPAEARPRRIGGEAAPAPFRRPPVVQRHRRRRRTLVLLRLLAQAALIVGLPTAAGSWALRAPQFAVRELSITGSSRVPAAWVEAALEPVKGSNLLQLSLPRTRRLLADHPWVQAVSLRKQLPDGLAVEVVERRPAAVVAVAGNRVFVDRDGRPIATVEPGGPASSLPEIRGAVTDSRAVAGAIAVAAEFEARAAAWCGRLEEIVILGPQDFQLLTERWGFPLVVRRGSLEEKGGAAERLLPRIAARIEGVGAVDLRFAERIVLQPEAGSDGLVPPPPLLSRG